MDKYSRPYRDSEGNWVGGYIQKRFEVDKWIPEENNMQLKPGELRKPRPVSQGNMESRMEDYRGNKDKVYNYSKAKDNFAKIKIAQSSDLIGSEITKEQVQKAEFDARNALISYKDALKYPESITTESVELLHDTAEDLIFKF